MNLMNYATLRLKCGEEHWNLPISGGDCPHHSYFMAAGNMKQPELRSGWAARWKNQYCKPTRGHNPTVVDRTWQTQVFWTTSQPHDVPGSTKLRDPVNPMAVGLFHVFSPCVWDEIKQTINRIKKTRINKVCCFQVWPANRNVMGCVSKLLTFKIHWARLTRRRMARERRGAESSSAVSIFFF